MERVKISFLAPVLRGGGAERNIINLVNNLDRDVYDICVVAGNTQGDFKNGISEHIKIVDLACPNLFSLPFKLQKYIKNNNPDILVSALPHINTITMAVKIFSGSHVKIVLTEHTSFSMLPSTARTAFKRFAAKFILPILMKIFYKRADAIICVSNGVRSDLVNIVGNLKNIQVIYNPVVSSAIDELAKDELGQDAGLFADKSTKKIIAVGRLIKAKDYSTMLEAFKIVSEKVPAKLIILGEGPEEKNLKDFTKKLSLENKVVFLGFKSNPYKYMVNSSVFVLSSIREGFGNVIVEAMACNVPVVATDCKSGPSEIINNGIDGLLVKQQDAEALSEAILKILSNNGFADKLAKEGKNRSQFFTIKESAGHYENVFAKIIK